MDLVVGATGQLGMEICRRLRARGEEVRALVRPTSDSGKVESLSKLGCEIVAGDLQDRASLERACEGVWSVVTTATTTISRQPHDSLEKTDLQGHINLIEVAEAHDVKRFVLVSFSGNLEGNSKLHKAKRAVEEKVRESGIAYTILRPSCFMEVWLSPMLGFDIPNRKVQIFGSGDQPLSFISYHDVAEFAVHAVVDDTMTNQTVELGGPDPISPLDVVKVFERELGTRFDITFVPEDALKKQYLAATDDYQKTFAALSLGVCGGDPIDMTDLLRKVPVKLTSVREYARASLS